MDRYQKHALASITWRVLMLLALLGWAYVLLSLIG